jgi:hypothetical protein
VSCLDAISIVLGPSSRASNRTYRYRRTFESAIFPLKIEMSSMATGAKPAADARRFYIWNAPGESFSIHLSLEVVQKMTTGLLHAAIGNPPRDISGVLLGRSLQAQYPMTIVEDFVFASGQATNHDSSSSDDDAVAGMVWSVVRGVEEGRHIVGFFRSQRNGRLAPNDLDLTNARRLLGEPDNVLLLIRLLESGESEATFFYWEGAKTQYHGHDAPFPFDATQLPATSLSAWKYPDPDLPERVSFPPSIAARVAIEPALWLRLFPTVALFGLVTAGIQMLWLSRPAEATPAAEMTTADAAPLGLKVTVQPQQVDIRWNQHSAAILAAKKAVLTITEGDVREKVPIDNRELRDGYVAYTPQTNDVYIRLEVSETDGNTTTESVRVIAIP